MKLRDYQQYAVDEVLNRLERGIRTILVQSPVGSGKTVIASSIIQKMIEKNKNVKILFIVNKEPLVTQTYETMDFFNVNPAVIHNSIRRTRDGKLMNLTVENVAITIAQSHNNIPVDFDADVIIFDEAHKSTSQTFQDIRNKFADPIIIGFTATPGRPDNEEGESLTEWYEEFFTVVDIKELIKTKQLVNPIYYSRDLESDRVVDVWNQFAKRGDRRTILFTQDTEHSVKLRDAFLSNGIEAIVITCGDDFGLCENQTYNQRLDYYKGFREGKIDVLISVMALAEGFDEPSAQNVFFCRSIGKDNISLYHQMLGRGLRTFIGKDHCNIVDFCGNFDKFGPIEDYDWSEYSEGTTIKVMEPGEKIYEGNIGRRKLFVRCEECSHVYDSKKNCGCPICGKENTFEIIVKVAKLIDEVKNQMSEKMWNSLLANSKNKIDNLENRLVAFKYMLKIVNRAIDTKQFEMFNRMYFKLFTNGKIEHKAIAALMNVNNFNLDTNVSA